MPPLPFQAFTIKANGRLHSLITDIQLSDGFDPAHPPDPLPKRISAKALWDTGASKSCVSPALVGSLGLTPSGTSQVHTADGTSTRNTYVVNFYLPNSVCMFGMVATEFSASHGNFNVLVGMDIICFGDFSITNVSGKTWMSFRTPSMVAIDYVLEANKILFKDVGRNDLCPCGSGKKFKRCHRLTL